MDGLEITTATFLVERTDYENKKPLTIHLMNRNQ